MLSLECGAPSHAASPPCPRSERRPSLSALLRAPLPVGHCFCGGQLLHSSSASRFPGGPGAPSMRAPARTSAVSAVTTKSIALRGLLLPAIRVACPPGCPLLSVATDRCPWQHPALGGVQGPCRMPRLRYGHACHVYRVRRFVRISRIGAAPPLAAPPAPPLARFALQGSVAVQDIRAATRKCMCILFSSSHRSTAPVSLLACPSLRVRVPNAVQLLTGWSTIRMRMTTSVRIRWCWPLCTATGRYNRRAPPGCRCIGPARLVATR